MRSQEVCLRPIHLPLAWHRSHALLASRYWDLLSERPTGTEPMESHVRRASGVIIKPHAHALFCIGPCLLTRPRRLKRTNRCVTDEWIGVDDRMSTIELVARQQANATGAGAKPKDPMMQPAGPGLPPLFVWLPKLHSRKAFYILWWILSGIVAVLVLLRLLCFLRARSESRLSAPLVRVLSTRLRPPPWLGSERNKEESGRKEE